MRIIYLHQYFNTPDMSGGTRSFEMARRFVAQGHEVHMVTSWRETNPTVTKWFETEEEGINVHWLPVTYSNSMSYYDRIKAFFHFAYGASYKANQLVGDVIFATSTPLTISIPAVFASIRQKIPMVFEVRDLWPEMPIAMEALNNPLMRFAAYRLERWAYNNSAAVVALSPGMKAGVVRTGYPAEKVAVIPNSCDNIEFMFDSDAAKRFRSARSWLGDKPLLIYAGTFGKVNGVGYAVELAMALLERGSDIRILLVGDGADRSSVVQRAKNKGVFERNLYVESAMPKNMIQELFSAATMSMSLFLDLPEMQANSANKFFDSLAAGKPILLNYGGWMHDLVNARECGLPMWQRPMTEVADALDIHMHNCEWLEQAGRAGRKLAEDCFDRDILSRQLITVLQSVVDGRPQKAAQIAAGNYE